MDENIKVKIMNARKLAEILEVRPEEVIKTLERIKKEINQ